jgi:tRNA threonylcarbamoyladenosine biosynthesis protein TsaE
MKTYTFNTNSAEDTMAFANTLAQRLQSKDVLLLEGDLGAGKTTFTKGLAKGLGVRRNVNSPTFTIIKEYNGKMPLYHMDVYRLENSDEDLGFEEYFEGEGVTVVEWAQFITEYLPSSYLTIEIFHKGEDHRSITLSPQGERYDRLCKELNEYDRFSN